MAKLNSCKDASLSFYAATFTAYMKLLIYSTMDGIGFNKMKVFKDNQWFDFSPITLLTGTNNSGKSSVINAMQMIQENLTNHHKSNIDEYINTEFRLKANQIKHGNIESFVNRYSDKKEFVFALRINNLNYNFFININEGLENFGTVKRIIINEPISKMKIFDIEIKNRSPYLSCRYLINYKFFVEILKQKCLNTIELNKSKAELDSIVQSIISKKSQLKELDSLAYQLSSKYSVKIEVYRVTVGENSDDDYYDYIISENVKTSDEINKLSERLDVLFVETTNDNGMKSKNLMTESEFKEQLEYFYEYGVFDFDQIIEKDSTARFDFESLISKHYNLDIKESYAALSNDLLTMLSNAYWDVEEMYSDEDELFVPHRLVETFLKCHPDFGLVASAIKIFRKNDEYGRKDFEGNYVANNRLIANQSIDFNNKEVDALLKNGFIENIYGKLLSIIYDNYNHGNEGRNFEKRHKIIFDKASQLIFNDIGHKIINIELGFYNLYISSNRFQIKRSYNFSDNTDFTSLLKTIEALKGKEKAACLEFVNKWVKEFEIADQLILKPDIETGNFKAYLKTNDHEVLLADFGLGTNQLLPIVFSLAINFIGFNQRTYEEEYRKRTVVIEEPESNLHPAMQSKLADLFVDSYKKFGVQIIVETHSEYLIRKLQYLVGSNKSELKPKDVVIYYFYKPDHEALVNNRVNQVEKIEIDEFGRLTKDFGSGFFDEADRISLELFLLSQGQSN